MSADPAYLEAVAETDDGPQTGRRKASARTCIATRRTGDPSGMLRFVVAPDGAVVPDLKRRLPGRGAWVANDRAALAEAIRKKAFARAFKRPVKAEAGLVDEVEALLRQAALDAISMANKAGGLILGFAQVEGALKGERPVGLIRAADAAEDGAAKLERIARARETADGMRMARIDAFTSAELGLALGRPNVIHAALLAGPASEACLARHRAFADFRSGRERESSGPEGQSPGEGDGACARLGVEGPRN